jgi:hypothetical protein
MKIKRQMPQRLRQKCLRGNPDGDITAIVEGRPNYITTHQISEGTHPSLALLSAILRNSSTRSQARVTIRRD